ncbi:hypothetical protein LG52_2370 [Geobacillus kaustophilus]|uniref:Uncharacterized protein n=1 Tax=Geobacillus kaustophilus TaxID=1462 RepID=A0A0D8BSI3_GEOKU|nr:hypothetical protein [Geobacillus kaustophilus]KJE27095.1 hypothetical protein LG52_2370 [Geobacillus kaustophilus]
MFMEKQMTAEEILKAIQNMSNEERWKLLDKPSNVSTCVKRGRLFCENWDVKERGKRRPSLSEGKTIVFLCEKAKGGVPKGSGHPCSSPYIATKQ